MRMSLRVISGWPKSEKFRTSPGPRVRRCCQPPRLRGPEAEKDKLEATLDAASTDVADRRVGCPTSRLTGPRGRAGGGGRGDPTLCRTCGKRFGCGVSLAGAFGRRAG